MFQNEISGEILSEIKQGTSNNLYLRIGECQHNAVWLLEIQSFTVA